MAEKTLLTISGPLHYRLRQRFLAGKALDLQRTERRQALGLLRHHHKMAWRSRRLLNAEYVVEKAQHRKIVVGNVRSQNVN